MPNSEPVVVMGLDAEAVADRVAELRARGRRAAGFVGEDRAAAEAMGAELFSGTCTVVDLEGGSR